MPSGLGSEVSTESAAVPSNGVLLHGQYITLEGVSRSHTADLWRNLGLDQDSSIFAWLPLTIPTSQEELWDLFEHLQRDRELIIYAIMGDPEHVNPKNPNSSGSSGRREALGTIGYLDVDTQHRTVESGAVLFGPKIRRSAAATEAHYLLLCNVFEPQDSPPYRRVAWKNNSLNTASRRAAERIGYVYEGTWRNHWIVKGRSRDSDWLSITDDEWPLVKLALLEWLKKDNFDSAGRQLRTLEEIRAKCRISKSDGH